jgi:hypothetical protein
MSNVSDSPLNMDDAFWRLHDALVAKGARRQCLRYYPRKRGKAMSGLTAFQLWVITILSIAIVFTSMAQRGAFDPPPPGTQAPAPDPVPAYNLGMGG